MKHNTFPLEYVTTQLSDGRWAVLRRHSADWFKIMSSHDSQQQAQLHADTYRLIPRIRATQQEAE